jgi:hypothetical protein
VTNAGNACGYPVGKAGFAGSTSATPTNDAAVASFQNFSASLAAYSGQTIQLRWRFSSDGGYEVGGAFVDEIRLSSADRIFVDGFDPANPAYTCTPLIGFLAIVKAADGRGFPRPSAFLQPFSVRWMAQSTQWNPESCRADPCPSASSAGWQLPCCFGSP